MLVEFSVENFRSFRDKVTLSMLATADDSLPDNVVCADGLDGQRLIRTWSTHDEQFSYPRSRGSSRSGALA